MTETPLKPVEAFEAAMKAADEILAPICAASGRYLSDWADCPDIIAELTAEGVVIPAKAFRDLYDATHPDILESLRAFAEREAELVAAETFTSIIRWGDETFGPCTQDRAIERAWEEWQEMIAPNADVPIEAADVIIVLLRIPGIAEAIQRKMAINRKRQWKFRGDGTGYHIPDTAALKSQEADRG